ncbi:hypothetical protein [Thermoplasma volcanium GSS1]|uniref:CRISPR system Cms protein Csm2 n=1 Tax=Thermoplasma volcanium (strain ATCC 51530 / DSM 4299 / JCM 9571 / NBRC 15438 / GSS1) TaxID=273116 RepID=Q97CJ1_THEVO|nr:type III-A CRISPR-associated protein Csm2 [Thermoplasma volcanium]BAB59252.1 hypothetical protein [Thermoplasma volcanium GSS1]
MMNSDRNKYRKENDMGKQVRDKEVQEIMDYIMNKGEDSEERVYKLFKMNGVIYEIACNISRNQNSETTQNQIRKFYDYTIKINSKDEKKAKIKLAMMMPQIYYAIQRKVISSDSPFVKFLEDSIDKLNKTEDFENAFNRFLNVFQAIVAYSKKSRSDRNE